jgi:hypothetical protein
LLYGLSVSIQAICGCPKSVIFDWRSLELLGDLV